MEGGKKVTKERSDADLREEKAVVRFYKNSVKTKGVKTMTIEGAEQRAVVEEGDVF